MFNPKYSWKRQSSFFHKAVFAVCVCLLLAAGLAFLVIVRTLVLTQEELMRDNVSLSGQVTRLVQEVQSLKAGQRR